MVLFLDTIWFSPITLQQLYSCSLQKLKDYKWIETLENFSFVFTEIEKFEAQFSRTVSLGLFLHYFFFFHNLNDPSSWPTQTYKKLTDNRWSFFKSIKTYHGGTIVIPTIHNSLKKERPVVAHRIKSWLWHFGSLFW